MKEFRLVGYLKDDDVKVVENWQKLENVTVDELINNININNFNLYDWYLEFR